jgi:outer membrane protein OmpA-like peptidoglycan-associated protein/tetratricopeptide (TPR) repeat protein
MQRIEKIPTMNITKILVFVFVSTMAFHAVGQKAPLKIKRKEFKKEEYGFKDAWSSVKDAKWLYSAGPGSYRDARDSYMDAYKYNPDNDKLNYMIGKCYLFTDNKYESIKYIQRAYELNPQVSFDIHLLLGMAYHQVNEFDNAIEEYNMFLKNLSKKQSALYLEKVNMLIRQCKHGRDLVLDRKRVVINNLGESVNSVYDEYSPVLPKDASEIYYTSRRMQNIKSERSIIDDKFFEDIYHSSFVNGSWTLSERLDKKILKKKNKTNIAVIGLSPEKDKLYLYRGKENDGDIYASELKKGKWSKPKAIKKFNSKKNRETSMCISSDGSTLYFISSREKDTYGGTDIYFSKKNQKDKWSKPVNIGNTVNTFWDEVGVSLSANDSILYFSSQGHNSMGGYDVFKTRLEKVNLWSKPENLGYPINTPDDDVFYTELPDGKSAYYATNRESGIGGLDIYKIIYLGAQKDMYIDYLYEPIVGVLPPSDNIYFEKPQMLTVDSRLLMRGFITDSETNEPVKAKLELVDQQQNITVGVTISDSTGNYKIYLPEPKSYGIDIAAKGYLMHIDVLDLSKESSDQVIIRNFALDKVEVGAKVVLQNIYFETGKATLKEESFFSLDKVVKLLINNETLRIEIDGHTDNVGSDKANQKLSEERAASVVNYLISQGIYADRLTYKGYGESTPIAPNTTDEGKAQNRRVEFKILSK